MNKTLLAVFAHPDDESFGPGGTLSLYASKGYNVYYVCATRGEAGPYDNINMKGFEDTAEMRTDELMRAVKELGLKDVFFLGYRDSGMPGWSANQHPNALINKPIEEVAGRIVKYIRNLKPDVIITFDPKGGYNHPDHIHIHKATLFAFNHSRDESFYPEMGKPFTPLALYFQVYPRWFDKLACALSLIYCKSLFKLYMMSCITLNTFYHKNYPIHACINVSSTIYAKRRACECHASQGGRQRWNKYDILKSKIFGEKEYYMQAYPSVKGSYKIKWDLFYISLQL